MDNTNEKKQTTEELINTLHTLKRKMNKLETHIKDGRKIIKQQDNTTYMILNQITRAHHEMRKQDALSLLINTTHMLEDTLEEKQEQLVNTASLLNKTL